MALSSKGFGKRCLNSKWNIHRVVNTNQSSVLYTWSRIIEMLPEIFRRYKIPYKIKMHVDPSSYAHQKQSFIGVLKKRCCENMQQICRRTPMPMCDVNKVPFYKNTSGGLLLDHALDLYLYPYVGGHLPLHDIFSLTHKILEIHYSYWLSQE